MDRGGSEPVTAGRAVARTMALVLTLASGTALAVPLIDRGTWYGTDGTDGTLRGRDASGAPVSMLVGGAVNPSMKYVYDTVLDLTWLADWNAAAGSSFDNGSSTTDGWMTEVNAGAWATSLPDFGGGWGLPKLLDMGGVGCPLGHWAHSGTDCGFNVYGDEEQRRLSPLAHMYYDTLGNLALWSPLGGVQITYGLKNTGPFSKIQDAYLSGTPAPAGMVWLFDMRTGGQADSGPHSGANYPAVAVRLGDVSTATPPVTPPVLNLEAVAGTSVSGSLAYSVGGATGQANESNASANGERIELGLVRQGYGYGTFASAEGGFLKAYAESIDAGGDGSSSASASASWTDYFLITGASGTEGLEATALVTASVDGSIAGRTTEGSASFSFSVTFDPANPCLSDCGLSDATQSLAQESRSVTGRRSVSVDTAFESEFTFRYGTAFRIKAELTTSAANGGLADFGHTGTFGLTLPAGAQVVTASGVIYGPTAPIPEPSTYAMMTAGVCSVLLLAARRRRIRVGPRRV
jgi:hypothetical protein